jgi:glutamate-1-semialdehyde 2,1-aminomutase
MTYAPDQVPASTPGGIALHPGAERRYRERTMRSLELLERTRELIPTGHAGGMWYQLPYPVLLERGEGTKVWDVDGNEWFDFRIGDWLLVHGHGNQAIKDAIVAQLDRGIQFGSPEWDLGHRMATLLIERMPSVDKVRFAISGTEVNQIALRLARTHTGRTKIAKMAAGYHGIADGLLLANGISYDPNPVPAGVLQSAIDETVVLPFNDLDGTAEVIGREAKDLAAVLVEPIQGVGGMIPATKDYLQLLRELTADHGIVLIYDEVVTFPVAYGGAQAHYGVIPDLTTMSKAIGGGLPLGAVGGRADIMDLLEPKAHDWKAPVVAASTFGGNQAALAAGIACLEQLTPDAHAKLQALGQRARDGIDDLGRRHDIPLHASGFGHLFAVHWAEERVTDFATLQHDDREKVTNLCLALNNEGYYLFSFGAFLLSTAVTDGDVDGFLAATERALAAVDLIPGG